METTRPSQQLPHDLPSKNLEGRYTPTLRLAPMLAAIKCVCKCNFCVEMSLLRSMLAPQLGTIFRPCAWNYQPFYPALTPVEGATDLSGVMQVILQYITLQIYNPSGSTQCSCLSQVRASEIWSIKITITVPTHLADEDSSGRDEGTVLDAGKWQENIW